MTAAPEVGEEARPGGPEMFDRIAARYDRMNRLMSFGLDRSWRRRLVRAMGPLGAGDRALDVATGTADVALAVARAYPGAEVVGLDPSAGMLRVGEGKVGTSGPDLAGRVSLVLGDAQALPFEDDSFAACCIAFGIRNVPDRALGLREMARVTRPGGPVVVLELSEPRGTALRASPRTTTPFWRRIHPRQRIPETLEVSRYDFGFRGRTDGAPPRQTGPSILGRTLSGMARLHVHHIVPRLGAWLSGERAYRYLQESIAAFPPAAAFADQMAGAGLAVEAVQPQTLHTAHLYIARVPRSPG